MVLLELLVIRFEAKGVNIMTKAVSFIAGAAVGAVAALMLSPNSGEENRRIVTEKATYYSSHGDELFQQAADAVRDKVKGAPEASVATADDIREKINAARDRIAEQVTRNQAAQQVEADVSDVAAVE